MDNELPRVLVVDDDAQMLDTISLYLKDTAKVFTVLGGRQAIEFVHEQSVDLILLDVEMPIMDGFHTLELLRKTEECINVPVILVTGVRDKYTVLSSGILGVDGYLVKPVKKDDLIKKVTEAYENRRRKTDRKTVLMIDDDMTYLKQLQNFLQEDYNVVMINSAKLAMNYLLKHKPDVILLDYQMPLYNGAKMMEMINKDTFGGKMPVIILSGVMDKAVLGECYGYKPAGYLAKPVTKDVLMKSIEQALREEEENV